MFQSWGVMVGNVILEEVKDWFAENKLAEQTGQGKDSGGQK